MKSILLKQLKIFFFLWSWMLQGDNQPYLLKDKGFSIIPPEGWSIDQNQPGHSLVLKAPQKDPKEYPRVIRVSRIHGEREINEKTGKIFQELIKENITKTSGSKINSYIVRQFVITKVSDLRPALVFYSDFLIDQEKMMQIHVLLSDSEHHYLLSFTDIADHFSDGHPILEEVWGVIRSIHILEPVKKQISWKLILMILSVSILILVILFFSKKKKNQYSIDDDFSDSSWKDEEEPKWTGHLSKK